VAKMHGKGKHKARKSGTRRGNKEKHRFSKYETLRHGQSLAHGKEGLVTKRH
jgi:hypothetical protein